MTDQELADRIAEALIKVERIPGVELCETKLKLRGEDGQVKGIVTFNPQVWREYNDLPSDRLKVMIFFAEDQGTQFYDVLTRGDAVKK